MKEVILFVCILYGLLFAGRLSAELQTGLVAYYPFNGNANDESGNGNHVTNHGATLTTDRFGNLDNAYLFNGIDDYMTRDVLLGNHNFSISFWFTTDKFSQYGNFIQNGNTALNGYAISLEIGNCTTTNGDLIFGTLGGNFCNVTNSQYHLADNKWHNVVLIRLNNNYKLIIDNKIITEGSGFANNPSNPFIIGMLKGKIDDIRIYNRVLSDDEVQELYDLEKPKVKIGSQIWKDKNLEVVRYRNGDTIPNVSDSTEWSKLTTGAWCYYNNDSLHGAKYGKLYNWYAVNDPRRLAPHGWRVPSDDDWKKLEIELGLSQIQADSVGYRGINEGGKLKDTTNLDWPAPNLGALNSTGFKALPSGNRDADGPFYNFALQGYWWTSTSFNSNSSMIRFLGAYYSQIGRGMLDKNAAIVVRCVKDEQHVTQNIPLKSGWNLISSYIIPQEPDSVQYVFQDIAANMTLAKNGSGKSFIPQFGINQLGKWNYTQAYQIYMTVKDTLIISGEIADPADTDISLTAGWNMISYLRNSEMPCPTAFTSLTQNGNLVIVKNNAGQVYIPQFNINSIGNLLPGQGYQIYVINPGIFNYPRN